MRKRKRRIDSSNVLILIMGLCLLGAAFAWVRDGRKENAEDNLTMPLILQKEKTEIQTTEKDGKTITVFKGKTYQFYEADPELYQSGSKIRGVYEEGYTDARYQSLFVGQVIAMFGDENLTDYTEALLSYVVAAEDPAGNVIYLEVYYGPSGPAIGGESGDNYLEAAEELEEVIRGMTPADYVHESVYEDFGVTVRMGVKDGEPFYEEEGGDAI